MIAGGKEILETLIKHLDFEAEIRLSGEGSETVLNVAGTSPEAAEELGSLIGRRGERLRVGVPHGHWKTTTFVAGLRLGGMLPVSAAASRPVEVRSGVGLEREVLLPNSVAGLP